ncbi:unnamed protein product, partial [Closterium sp. NIES-54]
MRPFARTSTMATPRVLRFDAGGRPLEFSVWLLRARRLLESQVQSGESLWAHATGDLPAPDDPIPLGSAPDDAARARFASQRAYVTAWKSHDAAACIALSSLLPESEEAHFTQVRTANLASFERSADLIAHLRSLDSSYRAACTNAQLALLPPPMAITIYFITTSLPDRLASVRDALLLKHPSELTIEVLESALKDVESNLRSVASAFGAVPPPLFHGCTVPQLPTFIASLATATTDVTAAAVTTSSRSWGRGGKRGGQGTGGGGGGGVAGRGGGGGVPTGGGGSAGPGEASRAAAGDPATAAGGGNARARQPPSGLPAAAGGAAAWYLAQRQQQQPLPLQQPPQQQQVSGPAQRQPQRGAVHPSCTYQLLTGARRGQPCGRTHPPGQCFSQLTDTVRLAYGVGGPAPDWFPLVQTYGPALWSMSASQLLDLLGTPHAMYAVVDSSASDSVYSSVASLGACLAELPLASVGTCVDTSQGARSEDTSLSFTLDSGASHCFFRDHTTLTPLPAPVSVALADPTSGPVTARYTTTLPCPAVPSGSLIGFHVPSFLRNLVGVRPLVSQHVGVWIEPSGETAVCVDGDTYAPLATFTTEPGSGLYTLHTDPGVQQQQQQQQQRLLPPALVTSPSLVPASHQVAASPQVAVFGQVPVSGPVVASCSCRSLAHPTVLWHHRTGHPSLPCLRAMSRQRLVLGLPRVLPPSLAPPCSPCVEGRLRATPHSSLCPATEPFETLHLDVWGPAPRLGPDRERFFLVVVDDYSRYTTVFPLAKKSEVTSTLIRWLLTTEGTRGRRVSCLHSDHGGEFRSGILAGFCREQGISQSWTLPESPQQNGVAERRIGLVMEIALTSLTHACAPHFLWPYAVRYAAHQLILWPRVSWPEASPTSLWTGSPGVASRFRVWGCLALVRDTSTDKLSPRAVPGVFLGFPEDSSDFTFYHPPSHRFFDSHEQQEAQELEPLQQQQEQQQPPQQQQPMPPPPPPPVSGLRALGLPSRSPSSSPSPPISGPPPPPDPSPAVFPCSYPPRPSPFVLPSPPKSALTASLSSPVTDYYRTYRPVLSRVLASLVTHPRASVSSVSALTATNTAFASTRRLDFATSLVAAPPSSPLAVESVFALGCDALEDRQFELEFLAAASPHLCAMLLAPEGDPDALDIPTPRTYAEAVSGPWASQWRAAMDAEMTYYRSTGTYVDEVPPPWGERSRWHADLQGEAATGISSAAQRDYELHSLDFSTAFLQGSLHEEVWLRRPSAFTGTFPPGTQWRLRRSVYGLRQAPREWHDTPCSTLADLGFQPSSADPSLFVRRGSTSFFVLVYVDDLVFATADRVALADVKSELQKRHTCTDLGELRHYLGLQITRDRAARTITLSQSHMVQQVLQRGPYAELVGCLMYLMTCTRPDLAFPLSVLARFVAPGRHRPVHWMAAVRVAKYLATTSGVGLVLGGQELVVLTGHCDSSYADDVETHRSTQGYCFSLGSGAVSWRSTRSSSVSTSTAEAEIYAGAMAAQELRWLTFLLPDLGERPSSAPNLFTDNKASILLWREPRLESRVKHIHLTVTNPFMAQRNSLSAFAEKYEIRKDLGKGQFGVVAECAERVSGRRLACKVVPAHKQAVDAAQREVTALSLLRGCENIVTLEDAFIGEGGKGMVLVMELASGGDLLTRMEKKGRIPESEARELFRGVAMALKQCHYNGVIHRDVKPDNVLLGYEFTAKLADFGIAKVLAPGKKIDGYAGSSPYEAPEVLAGKSYDFAADIWSLGVTLYAMLSGKWPNFANGRRIFDESKDWDSPCWWIISSRAKNLIRSMLATDPQIRPSIHDVLNDPWVCGASLFPSSFSGVGSPRSIPKAAAASAVQPPPAFAIQPATSFAIADAASFSSTTAAAAAAAAASPKGPLPSAADSSTSAFTFPLATLTIKTTYRTTWSTIKACRKLASDVLRQKQWRRSVCVAEKLSPRASKLSPCKSQRASGRLGARVAAMAVAAVEEFTADRAS